MTELTNAKLPVSFDLSQPEVQAAIIVAAANLLPDIKSHSVPIDWLADADTQSHAGRREAALLVAIANEIRDAIIADERGTGPTPPRLKVKP